jgi:four helix bundle protein
MPAKTYRSLEVWQKAMDLVEAIYRLSAEFPKEEKYGLTSQMQRAAVSVPANIAEGYGRTHRGDYLHHLSIARGSLAELETHLTIVVRLKFVTRDRAVEVWSLTQSVGKMLRKLNESLQKNTSTKKTKP